MTHSLRLNVRVKTTFNDTPELVQWRGETRSNRRTQLVSVMNNGTVEGIPNNTSMSLRSLYLHETPRDSLDSLFNQPKSSGRKGRRPPSQDTDGDVSVVGLDYLTGKKEGSPGWTEWTGRSGGTRWTSTLIVVSSFNRASPFWKG